MAMLTNRLQLQLEEARQLARYAQVGDIPARPRDLHALLAAAERMGGTTAPETTTPVPHILARAQRLLNNTGFDADATSGPLLQAKAGSESRLGPHRENGGSLTRRSTPAKESFPPAAAPHTSATHSTDVDAYITSLHSACVASCAAEAASHAAAHLSTAACAWQQSEWDRSKSILLSALGLALPLMNEAADGGRDFSMNATRASDALDARAAPPPLPSASVGGVYALGEGEGDARPASRMHAYASAFAGETRALVAYTHSLRVGSHATSGGHGHAPRVIQAYTGVAEEAQEAMDAAYSGMSVSQRSRVWMLLAEVVGEGEHTPAGVYAHAYGCETAPPSQPTQDMCMHWAAASLRYLSNLYRHVIETYVEAGASGGGGGGSTLEHVKAYVRMVRDTAGESEPRWYSRARRTYACVEDVPLWPCVYMSVRMGEMAVAREALTRALAAVPPSARSSRDLIRATHEALDAYTRVVNAAMSSRAHSDAYSRVAAAANAATPQQCNAIALCAEMYVTQTAGKDGDDYDPWLAATMCILSGAACSPVHADGVAVSSTRIVDAVWHTLWCVLTAPLAVRSVDAVTSTLSRTPASRSSPSTFMPLRTGWDMARASEPFRSRPSMWDADGSRAYALAEALFCLASPEHAVAHLCNHGARSTTTANPVRALCDAVHMALSLMHYGLLHVHVGEDAVPVRDTASLVLQYSHSHTFGVDLALLLTTYTSAVCAGVPTVCLDYTSMHNHGPTRILSCARVIASSRAYTRLCGPLQVYGGVAHGSLGSAHVATHGCDSACVDDREVVEIVSAAARACGDANAPEDAIALYLRIPASTGSAGVQAAAELALRVCARVVDAPLRGGEVDAARLRLRSLSEVVCATAVAHGAGDAPFVLALNVCMYLCEVADTIAAVGPAPVSGVLEAPARAHAERVLALLDACDILPHTQEEGAWARVFDPQALDVQHAVVRMLPHVLQVIIALYEDAKAAAAHSVGATAARVTLQQLTAAADGSGRAPASGLTAECVHVIRVAAAMYARAQAIVSGYTPALRRCVPSHVHSQMTLAVSQLR